ncbi:MAG: response regulator, partial [Lachnospiraceae bacterium]|nr:response regulator [Lachnospiraceae bacterium]
YIRALAIEDSSFRKRDLIPLVIAVLGSIFLKFECVETPYGNYSWGTYAILPFAFGYFYFFAGIYLLIRRRKHMDVKSFRSICMAMFIQLAVVIVQGIFPTLLISNIACLVIVVSLFYSVESPDAMLVELLADERAKAESANRAKSMFLAQMSHEIRTPMNSVLGMNEMILREAKDPEILEYSENIRESGRTLLALINSILDFSKIEDGKMEILEVEYDTARLLNNLVISVSDRARSKGIKFQMDFDEKIPCRLVGDDIRLTQVIMNLLTNAIKYTEKGSVTLSVRMQEKREDFVDLFVAVKDTGIGIRAEDMGKLTSSFSRIEEERNRHIEGTGLGMSIVERLLKMMDSSIHVESEYGKGSKFSFLIRQGIADGTPMGDYKERVKEMEGTDKTAVPFRAPKARLLIVDDNEMNLKVVKNLLKQYEIKPDLAASGAEAISMVREKQYHIIGLDHMMPEMDGIETLRVMRQEKLLPEGTVVIAMTANAVTGAKERYLEAGFDDYVTKPIDVPELERRLRTYLPKEVVCDEDSGDFTASENDEESFDEDGIMEFAPCEEDPAEEKAAEEKAPSIDVKKLASFGIDVEEGLAYCGNDAAFYEELLSDFTASLDERLQAMDGFFKLENWNDYGVLVHAFKSNAKMIGLNDLSEQARRLEEAAKKNDADYLKENHERLVSSAREASGQIGAARDRFSY